MLPAATRDLVARGTVGETDTRTLLERGLRSDEREVRVAAVTALSGLASDHEWALDGLVEALASELETPERVATELDRLAPRPGRRLAPLVGHPSEVVRFYVVRLLGRYPELARRHVAALTADPSPHVRAAALETLRAAGSADTLRRALEMLSDTQPFVRAQASRTAVAIAGVGAASFVAPLLADESWWVREAAREALVGAGPEVAAVVAPLVGRRRSGSAQGRGARAAGRRGGGCAGRRRRGRRARADHGGRRGPAAARGRRARTPSSRAERAGDTTGAGVVTFDGVL